MSKRRGKLDVGIVIKLHIAYFSQWVWVTGVFLHPKAKRRISNGRQTAERPVVTRFIDAGTFFLSCKRVRDEVAQHTDALPQALGCLLKTLMQLVEVVAIPISGLKLQLLSLTLF